MKKVLFILRNISKLGGVGRITSLVANSLLSDYEVHLLNVFNQSCDDSKYYLDKKITTWNLKNTSKLKQLFEARKIVKKNKFDFVIIQTKNLYYFTYLKHLVKSKIIFVDHDSLKAYPVEQNNENKPRLRASKQADVIVSLTEENKREYINRFCIEEKKVVVIPNFIDLSDKSSSYDSNSKEIVAVGRYHAQKRFDLLINSFGLIAKEYPDWKLKIYGDGELRENLQELINDKGLHDQVILCGEFKSADEAYGNKAFLCLTSQHEGFGLVLLEGFAYKLPAISFCCPSGPSEIIDENENGFLIKNQDVSSFSEAMKKLMDNKKLRLSFSNSTSKSLERFKQRRIMNKWKDVLK